MKVLRKLPALYTLLTAVFCGLLLCLILIGQKSFEMYYDNGRSISDLLLFIPAILSGTAFLMLAKRCGCRHFPRRRRDMITGGLFFLTAAAGIMIVHETWHHFGWDAFAVHTAADEMARGVPLSEPEYFQLCPNNAPIAMLQALILRTGYAIGLAVPFVLLVYLDVLLLNLSAWLSVQCIDLLTDNTVCHWLGVLLSILCISLSPYLLYPYTDSYAILFPVAALYCWLRFKNRPLKYGLAALMSAVGAAIKPTVWIFFIAMILTDLLRLSSARLRTSWKKGCAIVLAVLLGAAPGLCFSRLTTAHLTAGQENLPQLTWTHYFMLGMNGDTFGGHSGSDVEFTTGFEKPEDARPANIRRGLERLGNRSLPENLKFFSVKLYKAYSDGSFAAQNSFLPMEVPPRSGSLAVLLRRIYYNEGDLAVQLRRVFQMTWLMILSLCCLGFLKGRHNRGIQAIALTVIGLTIYLMLFEVWPRYIFLYVPFFLIAACTAGSSAPLSSENAESRAEV